MNIKHENVPGQIQEVVFEINKEDYAANLEAALKKQRRTAQVPGFRPGNAPMGMIKKMYEKTLMVNEIDRLVNENMDKFFKDNEIKVIFEPLPVEEKSKIDFENAEGNLGIANAVFEHLAAKLPISRLQRDLTDSTVLRNVGVPYGHVLIALASLKKGLGKIFVNEQAIHADLEKNGAVVAEAIQTILRREGYPKPYETLKELTRTNDVINAESIANFIETLNVSEDVKAELRQITPFNYTGM